MTSLLAPAAPGGLEVEYDGIRVKEPHLLEVTLTNESRKDIGVGAFSGGQLAFHFVGADFVTLLGGESNDTAPDLKGTVNPGEPGRVMGDFALVYKPHLLKGRTSSVATVLCAGTPAHKSSNVKLENVSLRAKRSAKQMLGAFAVVLGLALGVAYLINQELVDGFVSALGTITLGVVVGAIGVIEGREGMRRELLAGGSSPWQSL